MRYKEECQAVPHWDTLHEAVLLTSSKEAAEDIKDVRNEQIRLIKDRTFQASNWRSGLERFIIIIIHV